MPHERRNWKDPAYANWRRKVRERDNFKCQWPGCEARGRLEVHHIKTWGSHPGLRYDISNGITLCKKCHDSIKGKENDFEYFFIKVLEWSMLDKIKNYNKKKDMDSDE